MASIRFVYPLNGKDIRLHTELDWNEGIKPSFQNESEAIFQVSLDRPFIEAKPVIYENDQLVWSRGSNYTYYNHPYEQTSCPHFYEPPFEGDLSELVRIKRNDTHTYVRVYTPPGYSENRFKRYPVIYMNDGANLFLKDEAFMGQDWQVDETMDLLNALNLVEKTIVVGIYAGDRHTDYTSPGYEGYTAHLAQELKPYIDRHYRTLTEPEKTTIMGSSLGGVSAFYAAWTKPHVFGNCACLSSTFFYQDDLLALVTGVEKPKIRIYMDSGWPRDNNQEVRRMRNILLSKGYVYGRNLLYFLWPLAEHNEQSWSERLHIPFQFILGKHRKVRRMR